MAQRGSVTYLGSFRDSPYGIDDEGELFLTLDDAAASLHARHRNADGWTGVPVLRTDGQRQGTAFPTVTNDAAIFLWTLHELDRTFEPLLAQTVAEHPIFVSAYFANEPEHVVWIGARQAVRIGTYAEYEDQRRLRARQDVREAGSVVITDA